MSLSEAQEIYQLLIRIDEVLSQIIQKTSQLDMNAENTSRHLNVATQLERVVLRYLVLARRISGSDSADVLLRVLSKTIMYVRMLQMSISMLATGIMTGGFTGAIGILGGVAGLGLSQLSLMEGY